MPQGKGTYGSKIGRPRKRVKGGQRLMELSRAGMKRRLAKKAKRVGGKEYITPLPGKKPTVIKHNTTKITIGSKPKPKVAPKSVTKATPKAAPKTAPKKAITKKPIKKAPKEVWTNASLKSKQRSTLGRIKDKLFPRARKEELGIDTGRTGAGIGDIAKEAAKIAGNYYGMTIGGSAIKNLPGFAKAIKPFLLDKGQPGKKAIASKEFVSTIKKLFTKQGFKPKGTPFKGTPKTSPKFGGPKSKPVSGSGKFKGASKPSPKFGGTKTPPKGTPVKSAPKPAVKKTPKKKVAKKKVASSPKKKRTDRMFGKDNQNPVVKAAPKKKAPVKKPVTKAPKKKTAPKKTVNKPVIKKGRKK